MIDSMDAQLHFNAVREYIAKQEPTLRLVMTVKLYYAYFLTMDELQKCYEEFGEDYRHPDSDVLYHAAFDWFQKHSADGLVDFEEFVKLPRPFFWKLETLKEEFPELMLQLGDTPWVTYNSIDYSSGNQIGDSPLHNIEWYEERGLIETDGMLISRSIQRVLINEKASEKIVLAMEAMPQSKFVETFPMIPGMSGGCAFKGVYGAAQLDINYADSVGIDDVDTAMLCVGVMTEDEETKELSIQELPRFEFFNVRRTLRNGVEVPFIR